MSASKNLLRQSLLKFRNMTTQTQQSKTKKLRGTVIRAPKDKTVVVSVDRYVRHPRYGKYIKKSKKYQVHVEDAVEVEVGDKVMIREVSPISKTKRFALVTDNIE